MSQTFVGTKIILAMAMTRLAFCEHIGRQIDPKTDGDDAGYLVEYTDGGAPNHPDHKGFISWSPKEVFDRSYLPVGNVSHLPPHQQRVVAEFKQLEDRVSKLHKFTFTETFCALPELERNLLRQQLDAMTAYFNVLQHRIDAFQVAA